MILFVSFVVTPSSSLQKWKPVVRSFTWTVTQWLPTFDFKVFSQALQGMPQTITIFPVAQTFNFIDILSCLQLHEFKNIKHIR